MAIAEDSGAFFGFASGLPATAFAVDLFCPVSFFFGSAWAVFVAAGFVFRGAGVEVPVPFLAVAALFWAVPAAFVWAAAADFTGAFAGIAFDFVSGFGVFLTGAMDGSPLQSWPGNLGRCYKITF
jgi:hypothetical protein